MVVGVLLSSGLSRDLVSSVKRIVLGMKEARSGDLSVRIEKTPEMPLEIESIADGFNDMLKKLHAAIERQRQAQIVALEAQINPHFLYNTLNTIKWMATIQGADGIAEMLTALSHLLKNVSKGQADLVPLSEEFSLIKDYFIIMKYRYGGLIQLNFQLEDPALLNCRIPRFSLQPIVENSIFHGIEPKGGPGTVNVHVFRDMPDTLKISIQDDGIGMDAETIDRILSGNAEDKNGFFRHTGVSNVNQRIKYEFGESYGLSIRSIPGQGTTTEFNLPFLESQSPEKEALDQKKEKVKVQLKRI